MTAQKLALLSCTGYMFKFSKEYYIVNIPLMGRLCAVIYPFLCFTQKNDVCKASCLIVLQYPTVSPEVEDRAVTGC